MPDYSKRKQSDPDTKVPDKRRRSVSEALTALISYIPDSHEAMPADPEARARALSTSAALRSAAVSGSLAIPPGPLGMLTILPDLVAIWHIQRQLVADIAAVFGKKATLSREQMLYCLFRHGAGHLLRDVVTRVGERVLVRRASLRTMQTMLARIGIRVTQRLVGRTVSRWLPVIGAGAIACYAFYDTRRVGLTAIDLFRREIEIAKEGEDGPDIGPSDAAVDAT